MSADWTSPTSAVSTVESIEAAYLAMASAEAWLVETVIFWMGASSAWAVNT